MKSCFGNPLIYLSLKLPFKKGAMNKNSLVNFFLATVTVSALTLTTAGCGSSESQDGTDTNETVTLDTTKQRENVKVVFNSVPAPMELGDLIKRSGATYDASLLNDINNVSKYTTANAQGLNLGVYGADLSITSMFDQTQESIIYMKCVSALSKSLGIATAFNNETMSRMDANKGNHDSLMSIITDSYYETDDYLKSNQRGNISALMIAGGWVEALYVATRMAEKTNNDDLKMRVADMKNSLASLNGLLKLYKGQDGIDPVAQKLAELGQVYDQVNTGTGGDVKTTDDKNKMTTLGGTSSKLTPEQFKAISKKAEEIRNSLVKP
jgi:hypothetical protein